MAQMVELPTVVYPSAPWHLRGGAWIGLFRTDGPVPLPVGLMQVLSPRFLVVALIRYLEGTLRYNELIIGSYARRGITLGLYIHHIWVDDTQSLWGGRHIWGLRKELAEFVWSAHTVRITDIHGPISMLSVEPWMALLPRLPMLIPVFGWCDDQWVFAIARVMARLGRAGMHVSDWSKRFPYRVSEAPLLAVGLKPFHMTVPAPAPV